MPSEIAVPFRLDSTGGVVAISNADGRVRQHVLALLHTIPEERVMVPGYGTYLLRLLYSDPEIDEVATQASLMIRQAFQTFEPGVGLISVTPDLKDSESNTAVVDMQYRRLDAADSGTAANTNTAIIGASGTVREIIRG